MIILFCSFLFFLGYSQPPLFHSNDLVVFVAELITPRTLKKLEMVNKKLIGAKRAYERLIKNGKMLALFEHRDEQTDHIFAETYKDEFKDGKEMMHVAAEEDLPSAIDILIGCGKEVDPRDCNSQTPLMLASLQGNVDSVITLLNYGADPNLRDVDEKSALHLAVHDDHHCIANILMKHGAAINDIDKYSQSALLIASMFGYSDSVNLLLDNNADPNLQDSKGETALHHAAKNHSCSFRSLLERGADPNIRDFNGKKVYHIVAQQNQPEEIAMLLKYGAVIDQNDMQLITKCKDEKGKSALHFAAQNDHLDVIETLLRHGAHVDDTNMNLQTSLMIANVQGNVDSVEMLLKNGADATRKDIFQNTAHTYAVYHLNLCDTLFCRSDLYLKNGNEKTSYLYMYRKKYKKCIALLDYTVNKL